MGFINFLREQLEHNIYVDMDGVLTDFDKAAIDTVGDTPDAFIERVSKHQFWKHIDNAGVGFWENMEWMVDGKVLWNFVSPFDPTILTSPSMKKESEVGKTKWIKRNLKTPPVIFSRDKSREVKNGKFDILIDDRQDKIQKWEAAGGTGILHRNADDTIKQLKKVITENLQEQTNGGGGNGGGAGSGPGPGTGGGGGPGTGTGGGEFGGPEGAGGTAEPTGNGGNGTTTIIHHGGLFGGFFDGRRSYRRRESEREKENKSKIDELAQKAIDAIDANRIGDAREYLGRIKSLSDSTEMIKEYADKASAALKEDNKTKAKEYLRKIKKEA